MITYLPAIFWFLIVSTFPVSPSSLYTIQLYTLHIISPIISYHPLHRHFIWSGKKTPKPLTIVVCAYWVTTDLTNRWLLVTMNKTSASINAKLMNREMTDMTMTWQLYTFSLHRYFFLIMRKIYWCKENEYNQGRIQFFCWPIFNGIMYLPEPPPPIVGVEVETFLISTFPLWRKWHF